jgi:hypothetical protein
MKAMKVAVVVSFSLLVVFLLLNIAGADRFYKYVDKGGNLNVTDSLESVPQEYRASVKVIEFEDEQTQKIPQENKESSKGFIKIDPQKHTVLNPRELLKPVLKEERTKIIVIIVSIFLGAFIFSFVINKLFKNVFVIILSRIALVIVVIVGLYFIYLSYLGKQISQFMPAGEDKAIYTPSDILKQTKEIAKQAQEAGKKRQDLLEELTK